MAKKEPDKFVRHSSGTDKDYTIFDALLENLNKQKDKEPSFNRILNQLRTPWNLSILILTLFGWTILVLVGQIIWVDLTYWSKDLTTILFGSRIGEAISFGIGMKLIYYLIIGVFLIFTSLTIGILKKKFG
ncbi:MAG: hypothetical protein P8X91_08400 [Candidatus Bathyarchaeota archaeon]